MKNLFKIIIVLILPFTSFLSFFVVKAQSTDVPDVCFVTPESIIEYKNFVQDVLAEIDFEEESQGYTGSSNKIIQSAGGGVTSVIINTMSTAGSAIFNSLSIFTIIQKPYAFFRDYKIMTQLTPIIKDKLIEVGFKGKFFSSLDDEKDIIRGMQKERDLVFNLNLGKIYTYGDLVNALLRQNQAYKNAFVAIGMGKDIGKSYLENQYNKDKLISYKSLIFEKVIGVYSDANLFACNADFWEGVDMLSKFPQELSGATKSWQDGARKIKKVFNSFSLSEEEKNVLNKKGNAIQKQQDFGRLQVNSDMEELKKVGSAVSGTLRGGVALSQKGANTISNWFKESKTNGIVTSGNMEISTSYQKENDRQFFFNNMDAAGNSVVSFENKLHGKVGKNSPENITSQIPDLSYQIYNLMDILGGKEKEEGITYNLGKACELQCSNVGGKCWTSDN